MFEFKNTPLTKKSFIKWIHAGYTKDDACSKMKINPAALAIERERDKAFDRAIRDAEGARIDSLADKLIDIEQHYKCPKMALVASKNIQWLASKRQRDVYGEKKDITITHKINLSQAIEDAERRTMQFIGDKPMIILDNVTDTKSVNELIEVVSEPNEDDPFA